MSLALHPGICHGAGLVSKASEPHKPLRGMVWAIIQQAPHEHLYDLDLTYVLRMTYGDTWTAPPAKPVLLLKMQLSLMTSETSEMVRAPAAEPEFVLKVLLYICKLLHPQQSDCLLIWLQNNGPALKGMHAGPERGMCTLGATTASEWQSISLAHARSAIF
jgi:hypothetical protein